MKISGIGDLRWGSVQELIRKALDEEGFALADLQFKRAKGSYLLRVFIDHEGGVTINDCEKVSRRISLFLDADDLIPGPYVLEVSSPGIDRPLKKEEDFIRYNGYWIKVTFSKADQKRQTLEGKIIEFIDDKLTIEDRAGERHVIPFSMILKSRLVVDF